MLLPIRDELGLPQDAYESLDEAMIDVTEARLEAVKRQNMPFDHFRITSMASEFSPATITHLGKGETVEELS